MKRVVLVALLVVGWCAAALAAPAVPPAPVRWVTDTAAFLSPATRDALDQRLEAYERATGHQVIVWIAPTIGDEPIDDFAARVFAAWGIGRAKLKDGAALFVVTASHDLRIEVGYGLEERLGDLESKHILTEVVVPAIRAGHNDQAIQQGVDRILAELGGEHGAPVDGVGATSDAPGSGPHERPQAPARGGPFGIGWFWFVLIALAGIGLIGVCITHPQVAWLLFDIISTMGNRGGGGWGGGGWGGGSGGGGGFSGGGGNSGGGGASARW